MTELLFVVVVGFLVIAAASVAGQRLGVASPLLLVTLGVAASFLPAFGTVHIDPEWILAGILPPLLYSSAVSMPTMNFRREFGAISGLSVVLIIASSLVLGLFFMLVIPEIGFTWGVALGAIVSPTDAVATSIIKKTSVSKRVVAILDGEGLLNDATALVLLRSAIVATASSFSFWGAFGTFTYSVIAALIIGLVVGWLNLVVRRGVTDPTVNTLISFTVPFAAAVPTEILGASGLVAAVVAGLVTGIRAPRVLSPQNRLSDTQNWRTVELILEGAVFLTMGLQIKSILIDVQNDYASIGAAILIAAGALILTILVRLAYVAPLLGSLSHQSKLHEKMQTRLKVIQNKVSTSEGKKETMGELNARRGPNVSERHLDRLAVRIMRSLADIDYFLSAPLGWREGTAVVWAGMRGAVTVAAAQTLPEDTPQRSVLVLIAFAVALISLLLQGGTIGPLLQRISPRTGRATTNEHNAAEQTRIYELMSVSADSVAVPPDLDTPETEISITSAKKYRLLVLGAQRLALLDVRDHGTFDADLLDDELARLDAAEIAIELQSKRAQKQ
ncbi:cation:proton antiporter [Arthrobacter psychrochitiniphilus]|uniref:cation:proton antiporter n=1 Tax=Arthrobacter psychrochitiniphilus TaxID=291045 RepID=UPI003F7B44B0